jgi:hypothetical protein
LQKEPRKSSAAVTRFARLRRRDGDAGKKFAPREKRHTAPVAAYVHVKRKGDDPLDLEGDTSMTLRRHSNARKSMTIRTALPSRWLGLLWIAGVVALPQISAASTAEKFTVTPVAEKVTQLPPGPLFRRVDSFPTLAQAQAAARTNVVCGRGIANRGTANRGTANRGIANRGSP